MIAAGTTSATKRSLDASMTLLTEVMQRPLDPGYAAAAEARRAPAEPQRRMRRAPLTVLLSVVAGVVLAVGAVELRMPRSTDAPGLLREEVTARTAQVDELAERVTLLRAEIDTLRAERLRGAEDDLLQQVTALGLLAAAEPVQGPGAVYTLDDAVGVSDPLTSGPDDATSAGRVLDVDLQVVVNGLWAAGAEAISVNGQRLTSTSAIRSAGAAVLVDFRPLAPPYVVEAIGDPSTLQTDFARSFAGTYLESLEQNHGIRVDISGSDDLHLDGGEALTLRHATRLSPLEDDT